MFEFRVTELRKGDEFTADNGDSWWKVLGKDGCNIVTGRAGLVLVSSGRSCNRPRDLVR
jgi:hypothetical protein